MASLLRSVLRPRSAHPDLGAVAAAVQRLAVLLSAGVSPASAWGYLAEGAPMVREVAARGGAVTDAIIAALPVVPPREAPAWRALAAAWQVATEAGAPLADALIDLSSCLRDLAQTTREVEVALASPVSTARMVMVLPFVGLLFGAALGFDTLGTLFTTIPGGGCLLLGLLLVLVARGWNRRLVRSAQPTGTTPGLALDLLAIAVSGGASIPRAVDAVRAAREHCGIEDAGDAAVIDEVLSLSRRAGIPARALLRSEAAEARRAARSDGERRAATLSVTLMLPLGLCILPAFMLLGVAPLLIAIITSTVAGF
jgi:tight adherence protein B